MIPSNSYFFPYQRKFIRDREKYVIVEKSRRVGISLAEAVATVHYCLETGEDAWMSTTDERKGWEFVTYCREYAAMANAIAGANFINTRAISNSRLILPAGNSINAVSSSPRRFRGIDGRIILDEFALHDDQEGLYQAAQGAVIQRGCLRIISTHNGPAVLFYRLCQEAKAGRDDWSHHRITLSDAVAEGYARRFKGKHLKLLPDGEAVDRDFIRRIRVSCLSDDHFGQEFDCAPLALTTLIDAADYDRVAIETVPEILVPGVSYGDLYAGIDVGRSRDLTVLWVVERLVNPAATGQSDRFDYRTRCVLPIFNEPIPVQHSRLLPILGHPAMRRVLIDQETIGRALADSLSDLIPCVEPYSFSPTRKAQLAERLHGYSQYQRISVPKGDARCREDMLAMKRTASKTGNLTYEGRTSFSHSDYFWACAMALEAAESDGSVTALFPTPQA